MNTIKNKLYGFVDSLNLQMDAFKIQGLLIIIMAAIKSVLLLIAIISSAALIGFASQLGLVPYELMSLLNFVGAKVFLLILPLVLVAVFLLYIEIKAGLVARNNWNELKDKEELEKWSKYYIIYILFSVLFSFASGIGIVSLLTLIINIISAILYFYFTRKLIITDMNKNIK